MRQDFDEVMDFLRSKTSVDRPGFWSRLGRAAHNILIKPFAYIPYTLASLSFVYPALLVYIVCFMDTIQGDWAFYEKVFTIVSTAGVVLIAFNAILSQLMNKEHGENLMKLSLVFIGMPALFFAVGFAGIYFPGENDYYQAEVGAEFLTKYETSLEKILPEHQPTLGNLIEFGKLSLDRCDGVVAKRPPNYVCRPHSSTKWDGEIELKKYLPTNGGLAVQYELHGVTSKFTLEPITEDEYELLVQKLKNRSSDLEPAGHNPADSKGYFRLPFEAVE